MKETIILVICLITLGVSTVNLILNLGQTAVDDTGEPIAIVQPTNS